MSLKNRKMIAVGLIGILALSCAACGGDKEKETKKDAKNPASEEAREEAAGEVVETPDTAEAADDGEDGFVDFYTEYQDEGFDEEFSISQDELTLLYGRGTTLDVYGSAGDVTWENSDPDVVEMEVDGSYVFVTGKAAGRKATVTATSSNGERASCHIRVLSAGLYLVDDRGNAGAYSSGTYGLGKKHVYTAYFDGEEIPASDLKWESMDETIARVSDGIVEMTGEGITYIRATDQAGNMAFASVWVSDTDDPYEYETRIPPKGLFLDMFITFDEHLLENFEGESQSFFPGAVYDDGAEINAADLEWSVEDVKGHPFDISTEETDSEQVTIVYTQEEGLAFLVATNPATGHQCRYLNRVVAAD